MKILVVEDEIVVADNLCSTLRKSGYEPLEPALNYSQALQRLNAHQPDLALLDINLSGQKDGIDVAQYINENAPMPIIFITAYGDDNTLNRAKAVLPAGYLIKPFSKTDIKPTIEIAYANFQIRKEQTKQPSSLISRLSESELKIVRLIADLKTTPEIADQLHLSRSTIKNHRHNICTKLELAPSNNALLTWCTGHRDALTER